MTENRDGSFSLGRWLKDHLLSSRVKPIRGNITSGMDSVSVTSSDQPSVSNTIGAAFKENMTQSPSSSVHSSLGSSTHMEFGGHSATLTSRVDPNFGNPPRKS